MKQQKSHLSFKGINNFVRHVSGTFSKDTQQHEQAIQQSCDDLRQRGASEAQVIILEDFLQDVAEAVRGWPKYSSSDDKKMTTGFLAFNLVLLPLIYSWTKPLATPQIIALLLVIINIVFNFCSLGILLTKEKFHVEGRPGCLLSLTQLFFTIGTIIVIIAMLWYIFPPAVIVFLLASLVAFLLWSLSMVRGAFIAAHIRRVPPPQGNVQSSSTPSPPTK